MKQLINKTVITLSSSLLVGCVSTPKVSPSQNEMLNSISKSKKKKKESYFFQKEMDSFIDGEWKENVLEDKEIKEKYENNDTKSFTLQEFVDKAEVYNKKKVTSDTNSNVSKLENMPVIGK